MKASASVPCHPLASPDRSAQRNPFRSSSLVFVLTVLLFGRALSQRVDPDFPLPPMKWMTIETPHFYVHYHEGAERTGRTVAKVAEEIYGPVTSLYNHEPEGRVSILINDVEDISNGEAYYYDNKIWIYAPSMDYDFRGTHDWLRNVVTHEFTHIVQVQTSMKFGRRLPAFYLQWLGYEAERRPDVLYGYPNVVVSYPVAGVVAPVWFTEGVAQYNRNNLRYDFWDSHRDMILRSYALDSNMLSWEEMGVFNKTSLGNESSYNSGFAFVSYIARKYGEDKLAEISRDLASLTDVTIDRAIGRAVGVDGSKVYNEWKAEVRSDYEKRVAKIRANLREGEVVRFDSVKTVATPDQLRRGPAMAARARMAAPAGASADLCFPMGRETGFANLYPAFSPDGKVIAYVSTKEGDYFSASSLYLYDFETRKETLIEPGVSTAPAWSPDGGKLYYAKLTRDNPYWALKYDVYSYELATREEIRITHGRRAVAPAVSPDGKYLAYVVDKDGTSNLAIALTDGTAERIVTPYAQGEQVYDPKWSPSGDRLVFDESMKDGRSIAEVRPDGTGLRFIVAGDGDNRGPVFTSDGTRILFCSDTTGIFNLYSYDVATGAVAQVTNVLGGAFCPTVNAAGDIVYSGYTSGGYKIFQLRNPAILADGDYGYIRAGGMTGIVPGLEHASAPVTTVQFDWDKLRSYDDTKLPSFDPKPYRSIFTSVSFFPFIRVDNYNTRNTNVLDVIKPGVYLSSDDVLESTGFFAGAALDRQLERDLFFQFHYHVPKIPLLGDIGVAPVASLEAYNVTRKAGNFISLPGPVNIPVNVTYDLLEFDLALTQHFLSQYSNLEFRYAHSRYTSIIDDFINPETNSLVAGSSDLYLIANTLALTYKLDAVARSSTEEISPEGRRIMLRIGGQLNKFNGNGEYEETPSGLRPVYKTWDFTTVEMTWKEFIPFLFKNHTLTASLRGGTMLGHRTVDEFFNFYAGGLVGMRGYPFYAIGGNDIAAAALEYRFPVSNNLDLRILQLYFDKLYASFFGDVGNAWGATETSPPGWRSDAGVELRLETTSFYSYPTCIFVDAAYGFNRFNRFIPSQNETVTYGKEWRMYLGVLFNFDFE